MTATCACCAGMVPATPIAVENQPGLSALAYRIGTYADFKASLLARIAATPNRALGELTTRADDDMAIALCDAWAVVADVLTFYQERIANESYLRSATERPSVAELARLIDYAVRPGVSASTHLVFTLETAATAPAEALVPVGTRVMSVPGQGEKPQTFETIAPLDARGEWNTFRPVWLQPGTVRTGTSALTVAGAATGLRAGDRVLFSGAGRRASAESTDWQVRTLTAVAVNREADTTSLSWHEPLPSLGAPVEVHALRQRAPMFGHNAPDPRNLADTTLRNFVDDIDSVGRRSPGDWTFAGDGFAYLDGTHTGLLPGGFVLLQNADGESRLFDMTEATVVTRRAYTLSGPATRLTLEPQEDLATFHGAMLRGTVAWFIAERLLPAPEPIAEAVAGDRILIDGVADLPPGRLLLIAGTDTDSQQPAGEVASVRSTERLGGSTRVVLTSNLHHRYVAAGTTVYGNVAPATHGETVRETLGSADGSVAYQRMALRQAPLTYVQARTPTGAASTLELRVNDLLWREVRTLHGAAPDDRVYVLRHEDGGTVVQFGDGENGERPPTGQENITAVYRKGIGPDGLLDAGQLSQFITRPLGARDVRNPLPTSGAEPPESADDVRRNCTLGVHTLDRVVSLQDYEDHARSFAGIAKALASWSWTRRGRAVVLTVAGTAGAAIGATSQTRADLIATLRSFGDPHVPIDVHSYTAVTFGARVAVAVRADMQRQDVLDAVGVALAEQFGFAARRFGQDVTLDEVLAVVQTVPGVVAAHVTRLNRGADTGVVPRIRAALAVTSSGLTAGAELITLDPAALELTDLA